MKISTRGRYSLRMMIDLAAHYNQGYITLKEISERQEISKKYLEQIIPFLNRSNLLITNRGHLGGYQLSKHPSQITVADVIIAAEGSLAPVSCLDNDTNICTRKNVCPTIYVWEGLQDVITNYLNSISLQDILDKESNVNNYCI